MTLPERIAKFIETEPMSGCWLFTAGATRGGYAQISVNGRLRYAHRVVYELLVGPITAPELDHTCRVRCCVNPAHLRQVSHRENTLAGTSFSASNARKTTCFRGHAFDIVRSRGGRDCSRCKKESDRLWYQRVGKARQRERRANVGN